MSDSPVLVRVRVCDVHFDRLTEARIQKCRSRRHKIEVALTVASRLRLFLVVSPRWMPLEGLSHNEQLSVFLNLYHVMLLHAFFILGPPGSPLR